MLAAANAARGRWQVWTPHASTPRPVGAAVGTHAAPVEASLGASLDPPR
jgi:hypothetical protein